MYHDNKYEIHNDNNICNDNNDNNICNDNNNDNDSDNDNDNDNDNKGSNNNDDNDDDDNDGDDSSNYMNQHSNDDKMINDNDSNNASYKTKKNPSLQRIRWLIRRQLTKLHQQLLQLHRSPSMLAFLPCSVLGQLSKFPHLV